MGFLDDGQPCYQMDRGRVGMSQSFVMGDSGTYQHPRISKAHDALHLTCETTCPKTDESVISHVALQGMTPCCLSDSDANELMMHENLP